MASLKKLPYKYNALKSVISEEVVRWHHDIHQAGYVNKLNEIHEKLKTVDRKSANANYSDYRSLKIEESFNACGVILHEIYWEALGGDGKFDKNLEVSKKILSDFGSFEAWKEDFIACCKSARGWAVLAYDLYDERLHNYLCDFHHVGVVWGAIPILAIDVWEHAYYRDYGPDRAKYIDGVLKIINWQKVNENFQMIFSLQKP